MVRIASVDIPQNKRIFIGLLKIYGIGKSTSLKILKSLNIDLNTYVKDLDDEQINSIRKIIEKELIVEGDLRREVSLHIKRIMDLGNYRGLRHRRMLPVRGQRTKTNANTRKKSRRKSNVF